jgi:hypothetical protein
MNYTIGQRVRFIKTENVLLQLFVGATAVITAYNAPCEGCGEIHTDRNGDPLYTLKLDNWGVVIMAPSYHIEPLTPPKQMEDVVDAEILVERIFKKVRENERETA